MQGGAKAHSFDEAKFAAGSVGDMFDRLKQSGHLAEKDIKNKTIVLRIDIWAIVEHVSSQKLNNI
jgi:hypothetical protein